MATYWENSCSFGLRYVSWYKYLIVSLVFSHLGFWSGNLFLIAPFPDLCLLVPLNAPKVFLKRAPNEMRINLFNGNILLAWKANLDIHIVLEPYGCASYVVGYISKSQRGMSSLLKAAAKEARKGNTHIKKTSETY